MVAPLYARYVPKSSSLEARPSNVESHPTQPADQSSNANGIASKKRKREQPPATNGLYARYVPPASSSLRSTGAGSPHQNEGFSGSSPASRQIAQEPENDDDLARLQRKKDRKEKRPASKEKNGSQDSSEGLQTQVASASEPEPSIRDSEGENARPKNQDKKKKKDKKPGNDTIADKIAETVQESNDSRRPRKHSAILAKYEKSAKAPDFTTQISEEAQTEEEEQIELRDLVPIPQPEANDDVSALPSFSSLPSWLSDPVRVPADSRSSFKTFGLEPGLLTKLRHQGFEDALAVQAGVLPSLMPTPYQHPGDVCVSAATGSGKTLSYILPIVQSTARGPGNTLKAIIVVPTRELVAQVKETAETYTAGTGLKVGTAVGNSSLRAEQDLLISKYARYDPAAYQKRQKWLDTVVRDGETEDDIMTDNFDLENMLYEEKLLPEHVLDYMSKVDILICTPGRLVEHIKNTPGFDLSYLDWLVIDEADKLLDQSFQEWADTLNTALSKRLQASSSVHSYRPASTLRKVILSATMTRDLDKLSVLGLRNPKLILVQGSQGVVKDAALEDSEVLVGDSGAMYLPAGLQEHAVQVKDASRKPLILLSLLKQLLAGQDPSRPSKTRRETTSESNDADDSASSSGSDDSSDVSSSDTSSYISSSSDPHDSTSDLDSVEDLSSSSSLSSSRAGSDERDVPRALPSQLQFPDISKQPTILIFTSTNEAATRLSTLLAHLHPPFSQTIKTLTKSSTSAQTRKALSSLHKGRASILIATDRASRGLDVQHLSDVVSYDVPRSVTAYVHRVGRTARAGREGRCWTLVEGREAGWFWNVVARGKGEGEGARIERRSGGKVSKIRLGDEEDEEMDARYERALGRLKQDVQS